MKTLLVAVVILACQSASAAGGAAVTDPSTGDAALENELVKLEHRSWEAWKARDGSFFSSFLSDDHVEVGFQGPVAKASVVTGVSSPMCTVENYSISDSRITRISRDVALLVYRAEQKTTCGGVAVPSPVWASSLYVRRGERWLNVLYQQSPAGK